MLFQQTLDLPFNQIATPLARRNASPCEIIRNTYSQSPNGQKLPTFNLPEPQQNPNKTIRLTLPNKFRQKQKRYLRKDDPLIVFSPIKEFRKPPTNLFIKYLDGEISTEDLVNQTTKNSKIKMKNPKLFSQDNQLKKTKFNVLQKFIQEKISKKCINEEDKTDSKAVLSKTFIESNIMEHSAQRNNQNSIKKLRELQIQFFPKEDIPKTEEPVFNYKQVFNVESDQLLKDITEERNRKSQENFHQVGKELILKLQSRNRNKDPTYIPMEKEVIISKDVQLYKYLHENKKQMDQQNEKKLHNEKTKYIKYKGTERRLPIKSFLKYQRFPYKNLYQNDEQLSQESQESDSYSYNSSYLRTRATKIIVSSKQISTPITTNNKIYFPQVLNQFSPQSNSKIERTNKSQIKDLFL